MYCAAIVYADRTACHERAAGRRSARVRQFAAEADRAGAARGVGIGDRRQQCLGIGMQRLGKYGVGWSEFDDFAEIHDGDPVTDMVHYIEVVGDEDQGEAEIALQDLEKIEDLSLDRDVKGRDRLIGYDQSRFYRQGAGDADALPLAAAEGMRELVPCVIRKPDNVQQLVDTTGDRPAIRPQLMDRQD
jgi:hypothetical protein